MPDSIFLLQGDDSLRELTEAHYLTEANLQKLLADFPALLAGKQLDELNPRRWLLVQRELGIPDSEVSGNRWSIDHLFLDQDGIPTLVEVKRSTDTRIRREVIGQLLDYAANATVYWTADTLIASFEKTCLSRNVDPTDTLEDFLGADAGANFDPESNDFWERVQVNLRAGKIRMLIVADTIPSELQRIIEFLNEQLDPAEILGIAIKQYKTDGLRTLVPRVVGLTSAGEGKKAKRSATQRTEHWSEEDFLKATDEKSPAAGRAARRILTHYKAQGVEMWGGQGRSPSIIPILYDPVKTQLFAMSSRDYLEVYFQWYQYRPPFDQLAYRQQLMDRLNAIDGVDLPADRIDKRPSFALSVLDEAGAMRTFLEIYDWFLSEVRKYNS